MRTRMLSATARSIVPRTGHRARKGSARRSHTISRFTIIARSSIRDSMAPMIRQAKRAGQVIVLRTQPGVSFDPVVLQKEMARGRFCMGPNWWILAEAR